MFLQLVIGLFVVSYWSFLVSSSWLLVNWLLVVGCQFFVVGGCWFILAFVASSGEVPYTAPSCKRVLVVVIIPQCGSSPPVILSLWPERGNVCVGRGARENVREQLSRCVTVV